MVVCNEGQSYILRLKVNTINNKYYNTWEISSFPNGRLLGDIEQLLVTGENDI